MPSVPDEVLVFRLWQRVSDSEEWLPTPRLLVHVGDGGSAVSAHLSWGTEDGAQSAVAFSPDMASCYGHRRTAGGDVVEVRGELDGRGKFPEGAGGARRYEFDTEIEEAGGSRRPAGRLTVLIDDGGEAPVRWVTWGDQSGNACSVVLRSVSPSGKADISDLVSAVWADAEHREAGEVARNLVDVSAGRWFAPHDRASLGFRLTRPIAVDRYVLTSADDAPDRDPAAWTLSGSTDGHVWRTLDIRSAQSFAERHASGTYRIAEPGSYDHYRLDITGNNGSPHLQLEAVRFLAHGSGGFAGYRLRAGCAPVAYRGVPRAQASGDIPAEPLPEDASAPSAPSAPSAARSPVAAPGSRPAEWEGRRPGGPWLPLGGTLSMASLTSPSGRFTALHSVYDPSLAVRDNVTRERVWTSDSPSSSLVCLGPDGDLVARDHHGDRVWSTGTQWLGVRRLEMRDSGELALTDADGGVVWSTGIPRVPAVGAVPRTAARGSTMCRGESLYGQSLTSGDESTVLFHDGRVGRVIVHGHTSHWDRFYDQENVLVLDEDGFLRARSLDGAVVEQIAGPGAELVVVSGAAELRDDAGAVVWASDGGWNRQAPAREPAMPRNHVLAAWFGALAGEGRGYCVAVVKDSTPQEVLRRTGLAPDSVVRGTWRRFQQQRDAAHQGEGNVVAAMAVGPDVVLVSDDHDLPMTALAPSASVAALHQPSGGDGFGGTFSLHRGDRLVAELRDSPRRRKGTTVPEVAAALDDIAHELHRHELVFRTSGVVPDATGLGGPLLGGVLTPAPSPSAAPAAGPTQPPLAIEGYDGGNALVVRTDFTDEDTWHRVVEELRKPWSGDDDNDPVTPCLISDPGYAGASAEQVLQDIHTSLPEPDLPGVFFVADATTMNAKGHPLLAVSTEWDGRPFEEGEEEFVTRYRVLPDAAVEVSVNVNLGNMDFDDFAGGDEPHERWVG